MTDIPIPPTLGLVLAGGLARRMGGGDKARIRDRRQDHSRARAGDACAAMHRASSSTPTAIPRASPTPACRWCPTRCRISPARSPASSPGSTGRRRMRPRSPMVVSVPGDCPFLPPDLVARLHQARRKWAPACRSPARAPANGGIRWSACGRWRCARICATRWSRKTCARSRSGPRAMASPSPTGRTQPVDPFFNVNTPEDAAEAERIAAQQCDALSA